MKAKELKAVGIIVHDGKEIRLDELPKTEQNRLAQNWNVAAMKAAGYIPKTAN